MNIIRTAALSPAQRRQVETLLKACRESGSRLSFPFDEASVFYLLCDPQPAAVLALSMPQNPDSGEPAECAAFTRPDLRRRGYFSALMDAASDDISEVDLLFLTDGRDPGALCALRSLQAEYLSCEYKMELSLEKLPLSEKISPSGGASAAGCAALPEKAISAGEPPLLLTRGQEEDCLFYSLHADSSRPASPIACCRVLPSGKNACFYDFSVRDGLRGRGIGRKALLLILEDLKRQGFMTVTLHVSKDNVPAVRLYKRTGFRITETLSCYLY